MSIEELHKAIRLMQPESDGRYFSPPDLDVFIHLAVMDLYDQEYRIFEKSQRVTEVMSFFNAQVEIPVSGGNATLPGDLQYLSTLKCTKIGAQVVEKRVTILTDGFVNGIITSEGFAPDEDNIFVQRIATGLDVRPTSVSEITATYLRRPNKAKFGYTVSVNGFSFVYNIGTSVQIDFPEKSHNQILQKALRYIGFATKKSDLVQMESVSKAGNQPEPR